MSEEMEDGGPAFPDPFRSVGPGPEGMSLRDWYIGQSIGAVIIACKNDTRENGETHEQMFARKAAAIADAMLAARSTPK